MISPLLEYWLTRLLIVIIWLAIPFAVIFWARRMLAVLERIANALEKLLNR